MRFFEKLDALNQHDTDHGTAQIGICNEVVAVDKKGNHGTVTIGVPAKIAQELALGQGNKRVILLIIDKTAFDKL